MGIGLGILLIVVGAIIAFAYTGNIPSVDDEVLGMILIIAGVVALVASVIINAQRGRTRHIQENRYAGPPPRA